MEMRNPDPEAWPRCSECKTDYVLRRAVVFRAGRDGPRSMSIANEWVWQRDCKHRKAQPEVDRKINKNKRSKR